MTDECLRKYMNTFVKIYPTRPPTETFEVYQRVLSDISDLDGSAACEICLRELKFFPMPAEIRQRVKPKDDFIVTTGPYPDNPLSPEDCRVFSDQMKALGQKLGMKSRH